MYNVTLIPLLQSTRAMKTISYLCRKGIWAFFSLGFFAIVLCGITYLYLDSQLPPVQSLSAVKLQIPLRIYTQDGKLIQEFGADAFERA